MEKKSNRAILIWAIMLSILANVFLSRWITAKISLLPFLNRLKILDPQAAIVINQREEIRIADPGTLLEAVNKAKSKTSLLAIKSGNGLEVLGGAVNLTSDGLFLTSKSVLPDKTPREFFVVLSDGRTEKAMLEVIDSATNLVFIKSNFTGLSAADFGSSKDVQPGERVALIQNALRSQSIKYLENSIGTSQNDFSGKIFNSDMPTRTFELSREENRNGLTIVNAKGEIIGITFQKGIISSDIIKKFISLYFADTNKKINRPVFGFEYKMISQAENKSLNLPFGALVISVANPSPASNAGLIKNDVIMEVERETVDEEKHLEEILEKFKPDDAISMKIQRQGKGLELNLKAGLLKNSN